MCRCPLTYTWFTMGTALPRYGQPREPSGSGSEKEGSGISRLGGYNLDRFLKSRAAAEPIRIELRIGGDILLEMLVTIVDRGESCKEVIAPLLLLWLPQRWTGGMVEVASRRQPLPPTSDFPPRMTNELVSTIHDDVTTKTMRTRWMNCCVRGCGC